MLRSLVCGSLEQRRVDSTPYKIRHHLVAIDEDQYLQRGSASIASWELIRSTHAFLSFPGQWYSGISLQVKPAWQSRSTSSRLRSRRSSTLDTISPKHFFYLFYFLLFTSFCLSKPNCFNSPLSILLLIIPFSHSTGDNPQSWENTSISTKAKKLEVWLRSFRYGTAYADASHAPPLRRKICLTAYADHMTGQTSCSSENSATGE